MFVATVVLKTQVLSKDSWHTGLCVLEKLQRNQVKIFFVEFFKVIGKYF
jgi:hypothetical protein